MSWFSANVVTSFRMRQWPNRFPIQLEETTMLAESASMDKAACKIRTEAQSNAEICSDGFTIDDQPAIMQFEGIRSMFPLGEHSPLYSEPVSYRVFHTETANGVTELACPSEDVHATLLNPKAHAGFWDLLTRSQQTKLPPLERGQMLWFAVHTIFHVGQTPADPSRSLVLEIIRVIASADAGEAERIALEIERANEYNVAQFFGMAQLVGIRKCLTISNPVTMSEQFTSPPTDLTEISYSNFEVQAPDDLIKLVSGDDLCLWYYGHP